VLARQQRALLLRHQQQQAAHLLRDAPPQRLAVMSSINIQCSLIENP